MLFLVVSLIGTALSIAKTAHQCATYVWEQRVLQTIQQSAATPRSPMLKPSAEHQHTVVTAQPGALLVQSPSQAVVARTTVINRNYIRTTHTAQLESLLTLICGRTRNY
jgi:outer membrane cobalamin receptor